MAGIAVNHDDPFIVQANIIRLRSLLQLETDEPTRWVIRQVLAEFEACAASLSRAPVASQLSLGAWPGWSARGNGGAG